MVERFCGCILLECEPPLFYLEESENLWWNYGLLSSFSTTHTYTLAHIHSLSLPLPLSVSLSPSPSLSPSLSLSLPLSLPHSVSLSLPPSVSLSTFLFLSLSLFPLSSCLFLSFTCLCRLNTCLCLLLVSGFPIWASIILLSVVSSLYTALVRFPVKCYNHCPPPPLPKINIIHKHYIII